MLKRLSLVALSLALLGAVGACNTVAGVGKDVQKGGEALQKAAE